MTTWFYLCWQSSDRTTTQSRSWQRHLLHIVNMPMHGVCSCGDHTGMLWFLGNFFLQYVNTPQLHATGVDLRTVFQKKDPHFWFFVRVHTNRVRKWVHLPLLLPQVFVFLSYLGCSHVKDERNASFPTYIMGCSLCFCEEETHHRCWGFVQTKSDNVSNVHILPFLGPCDAICPLLLKFFKHLTSSMCNGTQT